MPGIRCNVALCTNSKEKTMQNPDLQHIRYHRFPNRDIKLRTIWIKRCRRAGLWNPSSCHICSVHFTADDYQRDFVSELLKCTPKQRLKSTAVPTLLLTREDFVQANVLTSNPSINATMMGLLPEDRIPKLKKVKKKPKPVAPAVPGVRRKRGRPRKIREEDFGDDPPYENEKVIKSRKKKMKNTRNKNIKLKKQIKNEDATFSIIIKSEPEEQNTDMETQFLTDFATDTTEVTTFLNSKSNMENDLLELENRLSRMSDTEVSLERLSTKLSILQEIKNISYKLMAFKDTEILKQRNEITKQQREIKKLVEKKEFFNGIEVVNAAMTKEELQLLLGNI